MKTIYPFRYIITYIPSYYCNLKSWQHGNQRTVYDFKKGIVSDYYKKRILETLNSIVDGNDSEWIVCFAPASCRKKTYIRYKNLKDYLDSNLHCKVYLDSIDFMFPQNPTHLSGKELKDDGDDLIIDSRHFRGKNAIIIDDVITTGRSLRSFGTTLKEFGAKKIIGLAFARTIHPNLPKKPYKSIKHT